jgi:hypothetical protein
MIFARIAIGLLIAFSIYQFSALIIRKFWIAPPAEPDFETIEDVEIVFSCIVCGAEVIMTQSPMNLEIEAPRHCKEDMIEIIPT